MHIVCSGQRPPPYALAPVGRNAPWLVAVLRRPAATAPSLLRTGPVAPAFLATIVDEALHAPPGATLDVTFHDAPDTVIGQAVPRLLRLASRGIDVQVACATRGDRPLRWRATIQSGEADVACSPSSPPTAA